MSDEDEGWQEAHFMGIELDIVREERDRLRAERDEARAAARKYLGPLANLPRDTREHVLRVHPWLKEE